MFSVYVLPYILTIVRLIPERTLKSAIWLLDFRLCGNDIKTGTSLEVKVIVTSNTKTMFRLTNRRTPCVFEVSDDCIMSGISVFSRYSERDERSSPPQEIMDYIDGELPDETITVISTDTPSKPRGRTSEIMISDSPRGSPKRRESPKPVLSPGRFQYSGSPSGSPRRFGEDSDPDGERSNSPKTPQHVPCMSDISTIVRRVRNVRVSFTPETRVFAYATTETCV